MLYGLIMDNFPLFHRHGIPYLMLSSVLSLIGFLGLGIPSWSYSPGSTLGFFWIALMGMGIADVITDALVVKKAKMVGQSGGANLQTFCWMTLYMGSLTGRPVSGTIAGTDGHGVRSLMLNVYSVTAGIVFFMAMFLKEPLSHIQCSILRFLKQFVRLFKSIFLDKHVLYPMLWIFFAHAIVPDVSSAMTYWKLDKIGFGANTQAYIDTIADCFACVGLFLYARFFKTVPYRNIFFWTQLLSGVFLLFDVILFNRWNTRIGLPDFWFLLGSDSVYYIFSQVKSMPFLILAAQLCPDDLEATFYASLMSISNGGYNLGTLWGGWLLNALHVSINTNDPSQSNYSQLGTALWIRVGMAIVPCFFIFLIPKNKAEKVEEVIEMEEMT